MEGCPACSLPVAKRVTYGAIIMVFIIYFTLVAENRPKKEMIQILIDSKYDSDPVKTWKDDQNRLQVLIYNSTILSYFIILACLYNVVRYKVI